MYTYTYTYIYIWYMDYTFPVSSTTCYLETSAIIGGFSSPQQVIPSDENLKRSNFQGRSQSQSLPEDIGGHRNLFHINRSSFQWIRLREYLGNISWSCCPALAQTWSQNIGYQGLAAFSNDPPTWPPRISRSRWLVAFSWNHHGAKATIYPLVI